MKCHLLLATLLPLTGCFDFGVEGDLFDVPPPLDSGGVVPIDAGELDGGSVAACEEGPTTPTTDGPQVHILSLNVDQRTLAIAKGQVVTWTNGDTMRHSVVAGVPGAPIPAAQGGFDSQEMGTGGQWAYRFCKARSVVYFCATHPAQMNGYRVVAQ